MIEGMIPDASVMRSLGIAWGQALPPGSILLFEGDLGTGKTTLIQGIASGLGITDAVESPTFTLINEYHEGRLPLYHFDLYRLNSAEIVDLQPEIYWEGTEFPLGIVAIEWADQLPYLPETYLKISLKHGISEGRLIRLTTVGSFNLDRLNLNEIFTSTKGLL